MFDEYSQNSFQLYLDNFYKNTKIENFVVRMNNCKKWNSFLMFMRVNLTIFKKIFLYIISVLYLSDMPYYFLPDNIRSRLFLGILGVLIFFTHYTHKFKISKPIYYNILLLLALLFPFLITIIINTIIDSWGFRAILNTFVFFAAFLVIFFFKKEFKSKDSSFNIDEIVKFVINIILINIFIAIIMFFHTPFKDFIFSIQGYSNNEALNYFSSFRLFGIGNFSLFPSGVFCSVGLILTTYFLKRKITFKWSIIYLIILISGIFFARTTLIGFFISIIFFFFPEKFSFITIVKTFKKVLLLFLVLFVIFVLSGDFLKKIIIESSDNKMQKHALELFVNFFVSNKFETESTNDLKTMYVYPDDLKTWIIGDGRFSAEDGIHYYKGTDVGYLRILFFMGLIGISVFFFQKIYLFFSTIKLDKSISLDFKQFLFFLFILMIVLNFKGFVDLDVIIFLFFWAFILYGREKKHIIRRGTSS